MSAPVRAAAAALIVSISILLSIGAIVLGDPTQLSVAFVVLPFIAAPVVGGLIAILQPSNRIGWLFCAMGLGFSAALFAEAYVFTAMSRGLPGIPLAAWLSQWVFMTFILSGVALFAVFPSGHLASRRLRPVFLAVEGSGIAAAVGLALGTGTMDFSGRLVTNPFQAPPPLDEWLRAIAGAGTAVVFAGAAFFAVVLLIRLRLANGIERQQLKWFVAAAALIAITIPVSLLLPDPWSDLAWGLTITGFGAGLPIAAGIAILRYRLWDIDVVIRRTLVYGAVVAILAGVYVFLVLALQSALSDVTGGGTLPVALSTLAIAALFGPVRARVRGVVDRRFYRSRYDAQRTLEAFAAALRDQVELGSVASALVEVTKDAVRPRSATVWIRDRGA